MDPVDARGKNKQLLSVYSPYLKRDVVLCRNTWYGKISQDHFEAKDCLKIIEQILSSDKKGIRIYKKKRDANKLAIIKECPVLKPYYDYIKIGVDLISDKEAIIKTVHGLNYLPSSKESEEIK